MLMQNFIIEAIRRKDCNKCSYVWECKKYRVNHGSNMCVYHAKEIEKNSNKIDKENEDLNILAEIIQDRKINDDGVRYSLKEVEEIFK